MLPIPAVQGGAVENLIDFYLEYNDKHHLHDITVYSPWDPKVSNHPALASKVNHYIYIDVTSLKARIERRIYKYFQSPKDYYNYFIEYYFEKAYSKLKNANYDYIIIENGAGLAYKLSRRGHHNLILHLNNDLLNATSRYHDEIFNGLQAILTCSDYIKNKVLTIDPNSSKVQTLYNAIDVSNFLRHNALKIKRQDLGISNNDFVIVYSGRINKDKGVSELIDAILLLKDKPDIKLMIIGGTFYGNEGNENEFVRSLKEKAKILQDRIFFTGFVPYNHIPSYLKLADIAVLPSMWDEPFGLTIVEALAAGLPLITTRSGGIPEICEGVATIVSRDGVVRHLADAILNLYEHPDRRNYIASISVERALRFDKENYAKRLLEFLQDLMLATQERESQFNKKAIFHQEKEN